MIQILKSLEEVSTGYSIFEENQVLTHDQLNSVVEYCTDQTRLTRVKLLGVGIVCGLRASIADNVVTITRGAGITTDGDLAFLETDTTFDRYKIYGKTAPAYPPFYIGQDMIPVYELVRHGENDPGATLLSQFAADTGSAFSDLVAVLFVESYVHDEDICTATDCDNLGKNSMNAIKALLIKKESIRPLLSSIATAGQAVASLEEIGADRPLLSSNIKTVAQLGDRYRAACNSIHAKLVATLPRLYETSAFFLKDIFPNNPSDIWLSRLNDWNTKFASANDGIQYYYDFLKDLVETWNRLLALFSQEKTWCCPDISSFPKHLLLGNLVPNENPDENRTGFYPSPVTSRSFESFDHARFLAKKLNTLILTFTIPNAAEIRITPSRFEDDFLEARAIPYYYPFNDQLPIHKSWNFQLSRRGMDAYNYSYNATQYGAVGSAVRPLESGIGPFSFFRIEGHLGQNVRTALAAIENEIKSGNLPFTVRAVMIGEDKTKIVRKPGIFYTDLHRLHYVFRKDLDYQLEDVTKFSDNFKKEVNTLTAEHVENVAAIKNIAEQKDSTILNRAQTARTVLNRSYTEYKADPAWKSAVSDTIKAAGEFKYDLGEVAKTEFTTPFDSIIGASNHHMLDWLDIIIKDKEDKADDRLLFAAFQIENTGLEHFAGVLRGGTFVLVYDTENKVVADFMLPYYCPDETAEEPVQPPLPKPPIKIPWIIDHGIKLRPSLDRFMNGKLNLFETDLNKKLKTTLDLQKQSVTDSVNILKDVLVYKPQVGGPDIRITDDYLRIRVNEAKNKREMIEYLRTKLSDTTLPAEDRTKFETQMKDEQAALANLIQDTTVHLEHTGVNVVAGTEGHHVITEIANNATVITHPEVVANVTENLTHVLETPGLNAGLATGISNVLDRIRRIR